MTRAEKMLLCWQQCPWIDNANCQIPSGHSSAWHVAKTRGGGAVAWIPEPSQNGHGKVLSSFSTTTE